MPARVTGFPFSWTSAPMYDGSTLLFLAKAIAEGSPVGLVLTAWVYIVYSLARAWEEYVECRGFGAVPSRVCGCPSVGVGVYAGVVDDG